jgi:hypothetical protein
MKTAEENNTWTRKKIHAVMTAIPCRKREGRQAQLFQLSQDASKASSCGSAALHAGREGADVGASKRWKPGLSSILISNNSRLIATNFATCSKQQCGIWAHIVMAKPMQAWAIITVRIPLGRLECCFDWKRVTAANHLSYDEHIMIILQSTGQDTARKEVLGRNEIVEAA